MPEVRPEETELASNADVWDGAEVEDCGLPGVKSCGIDFDDINASEVDIREVWDVWVLDGSTGSRPVMFKKRGRFRCLQNHQLVVF